MKKRILAMTILVTLLLSGCVKGKPLESASNTEYQVLLNHASCFVYTFRDAETGVWYISTSDGVTPRLNDDGSLYVTE